MAKKTPLRVASVDERLATLVDRGCEIDYELKNLTVEEKGTKKILGEEALKLMQDGELSLRLEGNRALATVVAVEKFELDVSAEVFVSAEAAIKSGVFSDAVKVTKTLAVAPDQIDEACEVLRKAGMTALVKVDYAINAKEFRVLLGSPQSTEELRRAVEDLKQCTARKVEPRVSYEKKD
jgi:hypothetical protein